MFMQAITITRDAVFLRRSLASARKPFPALIFWLVAPLPLSGLAIAHSLVSISLDTGKVTFTTSQKTHANSMEDFKHLTGSLIAIADSTGFWHSSGKPTRTFLNAFPANGAFSIPFASINAGGGYSSGGFFLLLYTLGQPGTGDATGDGFAISAGFLGLPDAVDGHPGRAMPLIFQSGFDDL